MMNSRWNVECNDYVFIYFYLLLSRVYLNAHIGILNYENREWWTSSGALQAAFKSFVYSLLQVVERKETYYRLQYNCQFSCSFNARVYALLRNTQDESDGNVQYKSLECLNYLSFPDFIKQWMF